MQAGVLRQMFQPLVLARIVDAPSETADPHPMRLADLFTWMHRAAYREFSAGTKLAAIAPLRRALQHRYLDTLLEIASSSDANLPVDARALARAELQTIRGEASRALRSTRLDRTTRAHLELLIADAKEPRAAPASPPGRPRAGG